jgi:hypothetical protein
MQPAEKKAISVLEEGSRHGPSMEGEKTCAMISMIHDAALGNTGRKDRKTNL